MGLSCLNNVHTGPFLKRFRPWNLWKAETTVDALAERYEKDATQAG